MSVRHDFIIRDPLMQPGVIESCPSGIVPEDLLPVGYLADTMVPCAFCAQHQLHRRGYFAVLPGGALALCGHCCAVKIAGKETVAKISRRLDGSIREAERKERMRPVTDGVADLLEAIVESYEMEQEALDAADYLEGILGDVVPENLYDTHISYGRGGLVAILKQAEKGDPSELAKKKEKAINKIILGLNQLPALCASVSPRSLRKRLPELSHRSGHLLSFANDSITIRWNGWGQAEWLDVRDLHAPDSRRAREIMARM